MQFSFNRSDLLKAIESLKIEASRRHRSDSITDILLQTKGNNQVELSASKLLGHMTIPIDVTVAQRGAVFVSIKHLGEILRRAKAETVHFTMTLDGQMRFESGGRTDRIRGTSYEAFAPEPLDKYMASSMMKRRRGTGFASMLSACAHLVFAIILVSVIKTQIVEEEDAITVEWVELPPAARILKRTPVNVVRTEVAVSRATEASGEPQRRVSMTPMQAVSRSLLPQIQSDVELFAEMPDNIPSSVNTTAQVPPGSRDPVILPSLPRPNSQGSGGASGGIQGPSVRIRPGISLPETNHDLVVLPGQLAQVDILVPEDTLGAVLVGERSDVQGHIRLIRLKHSLSDWWQDPTALPSFMKWLADNTRFRADMRFAGGALRLTDKQILDAPIIFMTGHDRTVTVGRNLVRGGPLTDSFSAAERAALRKYIVERGGSLFFDDCGFNGLFAEQIKKELETVFPEYPLEDIPHKHELYNILYKVSFLPVGGDVFWGSENKPKASMFRYQKGITIGRRLAVVYNRKDYLCAMETAEIESRTMLRMRRSNDVHRFMTNLLFYVMKYGGNTDRSNYKN